MFSSVRNLGSAAIALLLAATAPLPAGTLSVTLDPFLSGLSSPLLFTHAGDGSGRMFIVEQTGRILVYDGAVLPTPFIDLSSTGLNRIVCCGEQGLLGLAFHPNYALNGLFYLSYTNTSGNSVIERFTVSVGDPNVADTASATIVFGPLTQPQGNHNGGHLAFSPLDGYLYYGLGDGGNGGDTGSGHTTGIGNAQDTTNALGTILRLDVDGGTPYAIPPTNPFAGSGTNVQEIYAWGLRNPWRFSFDQGGANRLFCGDVGQGAHEEVDLIELGGNYGWRCYEGNSTFNTLNCGAAGTYDFPIYDYAHSGGRCSITGGFVYRGLASPDMDGIYFYGDYCTAEIWTLEETSPGVFANQFLVDAGGGLTSFGEDEDGELYVVMQGGSILRIVGPAPSGIEGFGLDR